MLISEEYRALNAELHRNKNEYGKRGNLVAPTVMMHCAQMETNDVLDYGCGKAELHLHLPFAIQNYDPAIPKYSHSPEPAFVVVCTDVLEHVEPEHVDAVLDDLQRVTKGVLLLSICLVEAKKFLSDGRNAHLSIHPKEWWFEKLEQRFDIDRHEFNDESLAVVAYKKGLIKEKAA